MTRAIADTSQENAILPENRSSILVEQTTQCTIIQSNHIAIAVDYIVGSYFDSINQGLYRRAVSLFTDKGILAPPFHPQIIGQEQIYKYFQCQPQGIYLETHARSISPFYNGRTKVDVFGKIKTHPREIPQEINAMWTFLLNKTGKITIAQEILLVSLRELENRRSYPHKDFKLDCFEPEYLGGQACLRILTTEIKNNSEIH